MAGSRKVASNRGKFRACAGLEFPPPSKLMVAQRFLKDDIANYYSDLNAPFATKKSTDGWQTTMQELGKLKAATPAAVQTPVSNSSKRAFLD